MLRTNINTIEGERGRALHHNLFFSDGLFEKGTEAWRDVLFWRKVCGTPSPRRIRMPAATAFRSSDSQLEPRFILELQEHVKHAKCYLTHGLEGLDVGIFLPPRRKCSGLTAMSFASWCTVRRNGHHGTVELLRYAFFSYTAIMYFTAGVAGAFGALHHMWKAWRKQEKKSCGFMVCCRECIPVWWGALVKIGTQILRSRSFHNSHCGVNRNSTIPFLVRILTPSHFTHRDFPFDNIQKAQPRSHGDLHDRGDGGKALRAARQRDAPPREQADMAAASSDGFVEKAS